MSATSLPAAADLARPPFNLRCRLLTPLAGGGTKYVADAALRVDEAGRIAALEPWTGRSTDGISRSGVADGRVIDLRELLLLPGLVDLHGHLPQLPNAGRGFGLDLLTWLERYVFPLERAFDEAAAAALAPAYFRALARAGTTTALLYGAVYEPSLDACFRAAEEHGIRAVIGKVMMDRLTYDERLPRQRILDVSLRQSADLCSRWHGRDRGRLRYAFTPRFAVSCTSEMLRESAALARSAGAYWQSHLAEDTGELARVAELFPEARDYLDVYDRAGALGPRSILAHAIHLSPREVERLVESDSRVAHCPASNLFLASGVMHLSRYVEAGMRMGLGSDVAGGPDVSMFTQMRVGAYTQNARRMVSDDERPILGPAEWLSMATIDGARVLGLEGEIGSLEVGKDADMIAVDPALTMPPLTAQVSDPDEIMDLLIFRSHPDMVRGSWVRGRLLDQGARTA
jgi:guanine deaminase